MFWYIISSKANISSANRLFGFIYSPFQERQLLIKFTTATLCSARAGRRRYQKSNNTSNRKLKFRIFERFSVKNLVVPIICFMFAPNLIKN